MLICVSDLHLTDESTSSNVRSEAFSNVLKQEITAQALNKAKDVHLVLLGDIFDLMRTDYWVRIDRDERPWNGDLDPETAMNTNPRVEEHFVRVLEGITAKESTRAFFQTLNFLKAGAGGIPVKVTYVIGNHDKALHLFPSLKERIRSQIQKVDEFEFAYFLDAPEYGFRGRHGHEWDINNHGYEFYRQVLKKGTSAGRFDPACYRVQTIGEVITAELMAQLVFKLSKEAQEDDVKRLFAGGLNEFRKQFMEVNNIRPLTDAFVWMEWFGRGKLDDRLKALLLQSLKECLGAVLDTELAKRWKKLRDSWFFGLNITDGFGILLWLIGDKKFDDLKKWVEIYKKVAGVLGGGSKDGYETGSKREWKSAEPPDSFQQVVYGHTHEAKHAYFEGKLDGSVRMYVNTGTFLPLIQRAQISGFPTAHQMTMAFFFRKDEDTKNKKEKTFSMDLWNGIKRKVYA
jgi:UDP-2,3-diacylglucosamine pyrophosphatase LpxH